MARRQKQAATGDFLSNLSPEEEAQLYTTDTYTFDEADKSFFVAGKSFTAKQLADALHALPEEKRKAVLL